MKNQGISLITLIITIIVIIILAAIVIFTGLRTPDSAQFSAFTNDVDTVYTAMIDRFADLKVEHSVKGDYRTNEQIYIELAIGADPGQYATMATDHVNIGVTEIFDGDTNTGCQNIRGWNIAPSLGAAPAANQTVVKVENTDDNENRDGIITKIETACSANSRKGSNGLGSNFRLPVVRQHDDGWYVTNDGRIFNSTGFSYNGNVYYNASYYTKDANNQITTNHIETRATAIASKMSGSGFEVELANADYQKSN